MANLTMFDSIDVAALPSNGTYFAGYVNGAWPTYPTLLGRFPHARVLSIAVDAEANAECLDVESGDAVPSQVPAWIKRQQARSVYRPVIYTSASNLNAVLYAIQAAKIPRAGVRLWSAHYGAGRHICGPGSCGYIGPDGKAVPACDGTQWTDQALGRNLDESVLLGDFFDTSPPPEPKPAEADMPGIWKQIITVTPTFAGGVIGGWTVVGIGEDGDLWTVSKQGGTWAKPERIDSIDIRA